jgi:hypothetical protein
VENINVSYQELNSSTDRLVVGRENLNASSADFTGGARPALSR